MDLCPTPFVICPPEDLLSQFPHLKHTAYSLSLSYKHRKLVTEQQLQALGVYLWQSLNLDAAFQTAFQSARASNQVLPVVIESAQAAIQNLPWEVLYHPVHGFLARERGFTLSRRTRSEISLPSAPECGPLRVLVFSSLPSEYGQEQGRLALEEEQENILEGLLKPLSDGQVQLCVANDGQFSTLQKHLEHFKPHLVFVSGHGTFHRPASGDTQGCGMFCFETTQGTEELIDEQSFVKTFIGTGVQCCVLSACESGKAASDELTSGLARQLIAIGVPQVIGMRESVLDRAGILFAQQFFTSVGQQQRIDVALQSARQAITTPLKDATWRDTNASGAVEMSQGQWCLPCLYSNSLSRPLIDWCFTPQLPHVDITNQNLDGVSVPQHFRGRRRELRELGNKLNQGTLRQLLIFGPGGQGKTALAGKLVLNLRNAGWRVVCWCADEHQGQSWEDFYLDLQLQLNSANSEWFNRVLTQVPDRGKQASKLLEKLLEQTKGKFLLLLDNLESMQSAHNRELNNAHLQAFIQAARKLENKGLVLLLTSRWALPDWPRDKLWQLDHLNYGDFLQLAMLQGRQLQTLSNRQRRLRQIYTVLNGNGRGLEFFVAATQGMTLEQEGQFLKVLDTAESELRVNMALKQLLNQLDQQEQQLLHKLQWYETPVPFSGVKKLSGQARLTEEHLTKLVAYSLLECSQHPHWLATEYYCSPLVTEELNNLLQQKADPADGEIAAEYQLYLYKNERTTLEQALVVHRALSRTKDADAARWFAINNIVGPLERAGRYQTLLDEWLPDILLTRDKALLAKAFNRKGMQLEFLSLYDEALAFYEQSLAIQREIGNDSGEGSTLNNISQIFAARHDYETALTYLEHSLVIRRKIGDKSGEATTLNNISQIYDYRGDYETALAYLEHSLAIRRKIGDKSGEGTTLNNISQIYDARGDYEAALAYLKRSLAIAQEIGDKSNESVTLNNIANIFIILGESERALACFEQSLAIRQEIGDKSGEGVTLNNISQIFIARGESERALVCLEQSLAIQQEIGNSKDMCAPLLNMGRIYWREDKAKALYYWGQAYQIAKPMQLAKALGALEDFANQLGEDGLQYWEDVAQFLAS